MPSTKAILSVGAQGERSPAVGTLSQVMKKGCRQTMEPHRPRDYGHIYMMKQVCVELHLGRKLEIGDWKLYI